MDGKKPLLRDRFTGWACNWLLNHVASGQYRAFVSSVYAAGRPALLWRLKNVHPDSNSLGLTYTMMDAKEMLEEMAAAGLVVHEDGGVTLTKA